MVKLVATRAFFDRVAKARRKAGDSFSATADRGAELVGKGFAEFDGVPDEAPEDISQLTVAQIRALAAERGIKLPSKAPKAKIVEAFNNAVQH